ncbi:MAG: segregation and condensation protein A [Acutalibacteraceae bacterium]|nr:segregation/condensation protein A [Oscillospiraceae bacterium]
MEKISYKLDVFEGPMDLLLHLISKHKLNINDIPILELVEQYTDYVRRMQEADMDVASEFLEMAARLVYIKTVSLLPVYEEAEQLKKELTGELIEYRDCKIMAGKLAATANGFDYFCREPEELEQDHTYTRLHEGEELFRAYIAAVGKGRRKLPPPLDSFKAIVTKKIVSVSSKISLIFTKLKNKARVRYLSFYDDAQTRSDLVATFLAILELVKSKKIRIDGDDNEMTVTMIKGEEN